MKQMKHEPDMNKIIARQRRVIELAEQQFSYQFWCNLQEKAKQDFEVFLQKQSQDDQSMLLSYVGSCQMVGQRLLNIACEHMDFPDAAWEK